MPRADEVGSYLARQFERAEQGLVLFAQIRQTDGRAVGCTAYWDPQYWPERPGQLHAIEIGFTWLAASAQGTGINTEAGRSSTRPDEHRGPKDWTDVPRAPRGRRLRPSGDSQQKAPTVAGSLRQDLREQMESSGPLPFRDFMQAALYHPRDGYYATRVPGHGGHYRTSPSLTPWFGRLVAREFRRMWQALAAPDPFWVAEVGGGKGDLAADALEEAHSMGVPLRWRFIERFDRVRDWQRRRLGPAAGSAEWSTDLSGPPVVGCVLANEVLDNFPVHVLEVAETGGVQEIYVDIDGDGFVERLGALSDVTLAEPARKAAAHLAPRARFEISSGVETWCRDASRALTRGYLLLIDYGGLEPGIWLEHPAGTVATYGRENATSSPLDGPGSKDITADVNFSAVARAARSAGFHPEPAITQGSWLLTLGIAQVAEELETAGFMAALAGLVEEAAVLQGRLGRLMELGDAGGLGSLLVLRAAKDAPTPC